MISLHKWLNNGSELISQHSFNLETKTWYRFSIELNGNSITVKLQSGIAYKESTIIDTKDNSIQRGKVGIGVNNFTDVYFS